MNEQTARSRADYFDSYDCGVFCYHGRAAMHFDVGLQLWSVNKLIIKHVHCLLIRNCGRYIARRG